jgi:hypothetical protein
VKKTKKFRAIWHRRDREKSMSGMEARQLPRPAWLFGEAMNFFGCGVIVLDSMGCILNANTTALAFFDDEVQVSERRLRLRDPRASADLAILTARLRVASETTELHVTPIIARRTSKPPLLLRLLPVGGAATPLSRTRRWRRASARSFRMCRLSPYDR